MLHPAARHLLPVLACAPLLSISPASADQLLYRNGDFITEVGTGFEGADISRAQTTVITFSISNTTGTGVPTRVIDDFAVPVGAEWKLSKLRFYATQSQASGTESTTFAFPSAVARVTWGDPRSDIPWSIVGGDFVANRLLPSSAFANAYRVSASGAATGRTRPIFAVDVNLSDLPPISGISSGAPFFIEYAAVGEPGRSGLASTFPLTPLPANPNGSQFFAGAYQTLPNQLLEAPFEIWGTARCGRSDVAGANQAVGFDGVLTADDIIVFLGWYFASDTRADVGGSNQSTTPDALLTADDIIVFLGRFFAGC